MSTVDHMNKSKALQAKLKIDRKQNTIYFQVGGRKYYAGKHPMFTLCALSGKYWLFGPIKELP